MKGWRIGQRVKVKSKVHGYGKVGMVTGFHGGRVWVQLDTEDRVIPYDPEEDLRKVRKFT